MSSEHVHEAPGVSAGWVPTLPKEQSASSGHLHPHILDKTNKEVLEDVLGSTDRVSSRYKIALAATGALFVVGIIAFILQATRVGFATFTPWGYFMGAFAFLLSTGMSAPLFSASQRMTRSHWRRPLARVSELFAVVGILGTLMFIPMIAMLPSSANRRTVWFGFPQGPHWTDMLAVLGLAILGIALLVTASLPDNAVYRPRATGLRRWVLDRLVFVDWKGTERQWKVHYNAIRLMGALYFLMLVFVHSVVTADFTEALVPGWKDAIFPATAALIGLQGAVASTLVALFVMRTFGGMRDYIGVDTFWSASKILLGLSLLWFYFWFSGFIIWWYGRQPIEHNLLEYFQFQTYRPAFLISLFCNFLIPFLILIWNFVRKSTLGPTIVSLFVLFGTLVNSMRLYVASFHVADVRADALQTIHPVGLGLGPNEAIPGAVFPGAADVLMILGAIGGAIFLYLLAAKIIPAMSIWELREGMLYRKKKRFLKLNLMLMGKPE